MEIEPDDHVEAEEGEEVDGAAVRYVDQERRDPERIVEEDGAQVVLGDLLAAGAEPTGVVVGGVEVEEYGEEEGVVRGLDKEDIEESVVDGEADTDGDKGDVENEEDEEGGVEENLPGGEGVDNATEECFAVGHFDFVETDV